jgi:hypothetical protein
MAGSVGRLVAASATQRLVLSWLFPIASAAGLRHKP